MVAAHRSPGFDKIDTISYGFYGRQGGVSSGIYDSLNCGAGSNDDGHLVAENRKHVAKDLGCLPENLLSLYQIHSDRCLIVDDAWGSDRRPEADGFVTDKPGIGLGVLTADCAPVLLYGEKPNGEPVIGAAHAGWKGAIDGVLSATISSMIDLQVQKDSLRAVIGPCIQKKSYEVDAEFYHNFLEQDDAYEAFFMAGQRGGHFQFDLPGFCALQLSKAGLSHIEIMEQDTYSLEDQFFSYRRKTHCGEPDYGRQISAICICP